MVFLTHPKVQPVVFSTLTMVNPGVFLGSQKEFLLTQKCLFTEAVTGNHVSDTVSDIQRQYFKRFPITLPHNEEPSPEWIAQVNDAAPDPEIMPPDMSTMDEDAFQTAQAAFQAQGKAIKARKEVSTWIIYVITCSYFLL